MPDWHTATCGLEDWKVWDIDGKLECQVVIQMIGRTWDRRMATYSQLDGPLNRASGCVLETLCPKQNVIEILWMPYVRLRLQVAELRIAAFDGLSGTLD